MKTRDTCARIGPLPKSSVATFKPGFVLDSNRLGRARYTRKNGLFNINSYIVQLIMLLIPCVCLSNTLPREKAINLITTGDVNYYFKDTSAITVERLAAEFGSVPPWQKIWLCDYLKKRLGNWDHCEVTMYEPSDQVHDISTVAGRASLALEMTLGIVLPVNTTQSDAIVNEQMSLVDRAITSLRHELNERNDLADINLLKKKYYGNITINDFEKADESAGYLLQLIDIWMPIGKRISELETITGLKAVPENGKVSYRFDNGYFGVDVHFAVEDGIITLVYISTFD